MSCQSLPNRAAPVVALALLAGTLAGCGRTDRIVPTSAPLADYTERHAIALTEGRLSLDVFPSQGQRRLDAHSAKQVFAFMKDYAEVGQGPVLVLVPRGPGVGDLAGAVADIRRVIALAGVHAPVETGSYPVADPHLASPVRLSFRGMRAKVVDQCGQWPSDLASGSSIDGWQNRSYWNFGCATQTMIAAQTADPRDLVSPRGEEPADTLTRARAIGSVRRGADPNTQWSVKNSSIGSVGGN